MATTTARNQQDVNNMSARERLWDSLNYSYGKKREDSDKSFAKAYSQAVNQGIRTGMQRSSYGAQTLANINKQKIDAQNDIYDAQIADYENRMYQIERDEKADEQWDKEYQEKLRQFNENMAFQKERANVSDTQWEKEYQRALDEFNQTMAFQREQFDWQKSQASGGSSGGGGYGGGYSGGYSAPGTTDTSGYNDNVTQDIAKSIKQKEAIVKGAQTAANNVKNIATNLFNSVTGGNKSSSGSWLGGNLSTAVQNTKNKSTKK